MHYRMASGLMIAAAALIAVPAAAGDTTPAKTSGTDNNERICQNITLTGSRLANQAILRHSGRVGPNAGARIGMSSSRFRRVDIVNRKAARNAENILR